MCPAQSRACEYTCKDHPQQVSTPSRQATGQRGVPWRNPPRLSHTQSQWLRPTPRCSRDGLLALFPLTSCKGGPACGLCRHYGLLVSVSVACHTLHAMLGRRAAPPTSASNAERHNDRDGAACGLIDADSWLDFDRRQPGAFARAVGPGARVQGALANAAGVAHGAGAGFGAQKSAESSTSRFRKKERKKERLRQ